MNKDFFKSYGGNWNPQVDMWDTGKKIVKLINSLYSDAKAAQDDADDVSDVPSPSLKRSDIETNKEDLDSLQKSLKSFCEDVSDNAFEECDVAFGAAIEAAADGIYSLCTDDFSYTRTNADGTSTIVSLSTIMNDVAVDENLKTSLFELIDRINSEDPFPYYIASTFITNQHNLGDVKYGWWGTAGENSCGSVAIHNALLLLGRDSNLNDVYNYYDEHFFGTNLGGLVGTNPFMIDNYLDEVGVNYDIYYGANGEDVLKNHDIAIALYIWNSDDSSSVHYVTYQINSKGKYQSINGNSPDDSPGYDTYQQLMEAELASYNVDLIDLDGPLNMIDTINVDVPTVICTWGIDN